MFNRFLNWIATHSEVYQDLEEENEDLKEEIETLELNRDILFRDVEILEETNESLNSDIEDYRDMFNESEQAYRQLYRDTMEKVA